MGCVRRAARLNALTFIVPGALRQLTGGYLFDSHVVDGLRRGGRVVSVVELDGSFPTADRVACEAAAAALAVQPDTRVVVIDGLAMPAFDGCLEAHARRLRIVGFVHHPLSLETGLTAVQASHFAAIETRSWRQLRGVICPSGATARAIADAGISTQRIAVVAPGTAKPCAAPARGRAPEQTAAVQGPDQPNAPCAVELLCVGAVTARKGQLQLVEALAGMAGAPWRLTCVGSLKRDSSTADALRAAIRSHGLDARVRLAGEIAARDLAAEYARADVFVLPSFHEGYGMACAEALAHGLPIVATHAGAIPDTVPAAAALFVGPGDVAALRAALGRIVQDTALRTRLASAAGAAGAALPDWPVAVDAWAAALDRLAA